MKIGIFGAGISGISIARMLNGLADVEVLEKNGFIGGIARPKNINGIPYHTTGGHCFNSKNPEVIDFVFSFLPASKWHKVNRNAKIFFKGKKINYPIEFAIKEIAAYDEELAFNIVNDFFNARDKECSNLEEWFESKFGKTLSREYHVPYSRKIWATEPSQMSLEWVEGKLPLPDKKAFFRGLIYKESDNMPHSQFYYPNSNTMETFIDEMAKGLNIHLNYNINQIEKKEEKWVINKDKEYDIIVSTILLKDLPKMISGTPKNIIDAAEKLKFNCVSNVLWETDPIPEDGWMYLPSDKTFLHKIANIGNFLIPKIDTVSTTEAIGTISKDEMVREGNKFNFLKKPLAYNTSGPAYVVYDKNYKSSVLLLKKYFDTLGIHLLGRFGEWEYYNMDKCIESAMRLSEKIKPLLK